MRRLNRGSPKTDDLLRDAIVAAPRIGVVLLVPDRWRGIWTLRHHVAHRLARHFEVVWVEAARPWREYWGLARARDVIAHDIPPDFPGLSVYDPGRWLAKVHKPRALSDWIHRARMQAAVNILRSKGCTRVITYVWRPEFAWALDAFDADLTCYHIDDEYSFTASDQPNDPAEVALIQRVDQVFIHSSGLLRKKGGINPNTAHVPNGVDYAAYSTPVAEPADLAAIPRPRIGEVGVVKAQLDLLRLAQLARANPEWSCVVVGPRGFLGKKAGVLNELTALPNVHLLGNRAVHALPAYVQGMDVCVMPYEINDYTNFIYPLKLHEYLATGRPTVATPINSVVPFMEVVGLATSVPEWQAAIENALTPAASSPEAVRARREHAAEHDWDLLVAQIASRLQGRLNEKAAGVPEPREPPREPPRERVDAYATGGGG
jgi:glycosyltransferase involved in cell wall biosynthesis